MVGGGKSVFRFFLSLLIALSLQSCSGLSKNITKKGHLKINGGRYGDKSWSKNLAFRRISWYHGMTLMFDLLYTKLDKNNPFYNWLSMSERRSLESCQDHVIVMSYQFDSKRISKSMLLNGAQKMGYKALLLKDFARHLKMHPDFSSLTPSLYDVDALCHQTGNKQSIPLNFPGFKQVLISGATN